MQNEKLLAEVKLFRDLLAKCHDLCMNPTVPGDYPDHVCYKEILFELLECVFQEEIRQMYCTSNTHPTYCSELFLKCWLEDYAARTLENRINDSDNVCATCFTKGINRRELRSMINMNMRDRHNTCDLVGMVLERHLALRFRVIPRSLLRRIMELSVYDVLLDLQTQGEIRVVDR